MYPFYETLEYPHQFRAAREEAFETKRVRMENGTHDLRKLRRRMRKLLKENDHDFCVINITHPGKWIGQVYRSSRAFVGAYAGVRSEAEYYSRAYY
jgi:hypothetical protein